ncbi:MAG TPA: hypothetical protein VEP89_14370, partial [Draconibacterium sp.]|nr:hypothetical protein [Draconibacterium sp.]
IDMLLKFFEEKTSENEISILNENTAFKSQIINNHELRQEIEILLKSLKKNQELNIEQFKPLDTLIGVLDNERSNLFRKMRNVSE